MASRQRFEGPVLEDVLDRVRAEIGPGARIVAANRVRKGGVGGFFAREHFEVIAERAVGSAVAEALAPPPARPSGNGRVSVPTSILDLAEVVNDAERDGDTTIDLVADEASAAGDGSAFAAMLDRLTTTDQGGIGSHAESGAVDDEIAILHDDGAERPPTARADRPPALSTPVRDQLRSVADGARRSATAARVVDDPAVAAPEPQDAAVTAASVTPAVFRRARSDEVIERPENTLVRLGVPARLVPRGAEMREMRAMLVESLSRLPAPPLLPDAPGVVVAVVGTGVQPVLLARDLAEELGIDADRVVLATQEPLGEGVPAWLQVCDPQTAEERRRHDRRRSYPTVVACSLPPGLGNLGWARAMLDHLEPTCTWAIVDAAWKAEDVQHRADALGGVDVLALTRLAETVSPAAVLDLGIAVGRLDGRPATAVTWAETLMQRLAELA